MGNCTSKDATADAADAPAKQQHEEQEQPPQPTRYEHAREDPTIPPPEKNDCPTQLVFA